jgi:chromosomal replication initiator protein
MQPGKRPEDGVRAVNDDRDFEDRVFKALAERLGERQYGLWCAGRIRAEAQADELIISVGSPFLQNWFLRQFREPVQQVAQQLLGSHARISFVVNAALLAASKRSTETATLPERSPRGGTESSLGDIAASVVEVLPVPSPTSGSLANGTPTNSSGANGSALAASNDESGARARAASRSGAGLPSTARRTSVSPRQRRLLSLEDFVPNSPNDMAMTAARQAVQKPGQSCNPLYLHGPVGVGKTHLLEGICRELRRTSPSLNVMLITAEGFGNSFAEALQEKKLPGFRLRFRGVDVLLVDDVDFFEAKRGFQEEFLHTLGELIDHGRQVVMTGDRHPKLLTRLNDDVVSRLLSGVVCRIETPGLEVRREIVTAKAKRLSGEFAPEALQYLAERFSSNVRELEGALHSLQTYFLATQRRVTLTAAREVLGELARDCKRLVKLADVERVVCQLFGLKAKELKSDSRVRTLAQPRMLAMFLARKHTAAAYSEIGRHFGNRNHSTVMSAERKVQQWLQTGEPVRVATQTWSFPEIVATLEQQLLAG